ncbi:MAG: lasso peptide biosynthesis B2 protein [Thermoclostridium sp.]|nr:lasso peptide biosynthesis B2 protein [Thermoclostridium sp.]
MKYLRKFIILPFRVKAALVEAYLCLGFARFLIWRFQFKRFAWIFGQVNCETEFSDEGLDPAKMKEVSQAIRTMSRHTFWESKCLAQACAAKIMLNRRKQRSTVYLGVAKDSRGEMIAHAWVRCGTRYITGGDGSKKFTTTSKFT